MLFKNFFFLFLLFNLNEIEIDCHGRLIDPPARSSCWREFGSKCNADYTDMEMFCGGAQVQWQQNNGKCGICGDNWSGVRKYERGGSGYTGFLVRNYLQGQIIDAKVTITANHGGWFEFRLCNSDSLYAQGLDATHDCLDKNLLKGLNGETRFKINQADGYKDYSFKLVLPSNLACNRCVFQWKYNTGNSWGTDPVTGQSGMGLGPQEQFYGCSDVSIRSNQGGLSTLNPPSSSSSAQTSTRPVSVTTMKLTTTNNNNNIITTSKCPNGAGYYPDKNSACQKYYQCVAFGSTFLTYDFTCPSGLVFDIKYNVCNYPNLVIC